jgi:hypothetical protein
MTGRPLIDDYLAQLSTELTVPRRMRARVLAEAEDHLLCASGDLALEGRSEVEAEREAIARYGCAKLVAHSHARTMSIRATARLATGTTVSVGSFVALFVATTQLPAVHAGVPATAMTSGATGAVGWIAVQIAVACGALAVIRCLRLRGEYQGRAGTLRLANRTAATSVVAMGLSLLCDIAAFVRMPPGQGQHAALVFGLVLLAMATTAGAAAQILVAQRRLRALERNGHEPASEDALDDVCAAALATLRALATVPIAGPAASLMERVVGRRLAAGSPLTSVLRRHPWRSGAAVALLTGLLTSCGHLIAEGAPTDGVSVAFLAALLIASIEGAAVFGCYLLFGRFLGIRNSGRPRISS